MNKKTRRTILSSAFMLFASVCMLGTATFAWLSMNRQTESTGMQMDVETTANLVISKTTSFTDHLVSVDFTTTARKFLPAMHSGSATATTASNLQYVKDSVTVDRNTGLATTAISYNTVTLANDSLYYIDFVTYIASEGKEIPTSDLTAVISAPATPYSDAEHTYLNAASIDFYVNDAYTETLNLAGLALSNDTTYSGAAKTTATLVSNGTIPLTTATPIKVTMRCYFDGALLQSASKTYVTTNDLPVSGVVLGVKFTAAAHV